MDPDVYAFARSFGNPQSGQIRLRRAAVQAVSNNVVDLCMDAAPGTTTHQGVEYLGTLPPRVGESVWVIVVGGEVICLGSTVDQGGDAPYVEVYRNADTATNAAGYTNITFNTLANGTDPWGMFTSPPSVVIPVRGIYAISATVAITANAGGTYRGARILVDSDIKATTQTVHPTGTVGSAQETFVNVSWIGRALANDVVQVAYGHNSGTSLAATANGPAPRLSVAYVGGVE